LERSSQSRGVGLSSVRWPSSAAIAWLDREAVAALGKAVREVAAELTVALGSVMPEEKSS
jgi:hypothetical protein